MFNFISNLLYSLKSEKAKRRDMQKGYDSVFENVNDLPSDEERKSMSEKKLAILLSNCKATTPAYILIEHELNRRIAKIQAMPTYIGIISGLAGVALGAWLNSYFQQVPVVNCVYPASTAKSAENENLNRPTPPGTNAVPKEPIKSLSDSKPTPKDAASKNHN